MSQIRCRSAWSWRRLRLGVVAAAVLLVSGMVGLSPAPTALASTVTTGGFTSLAPSRLLDTRIGVGAIKAAAVAGGTVHLQVAGRGGVPASGVSAVVLNVTVTAPATAGFLTVYGDGTALPGASNLNFVKSQSVPNLVIAPVGANGKVALFNGSGGTVQLVADVSGYYLAGAPVVAGAFGSLAPSRLLDTRIGVGAIKAAAVAGGTVHLQVAGRGGVPASGVSAVVLNVTVTAPATAGFLTVYGDGTALPGASNLNFVKSQSVPNLVIAPVGANGKVALFNGSGGTVQLVADVSGYYLAGDVGGPGKIRPGTTAAGSDHSCAVTTGGGVKCWGYNEYGKLGDGTTTYLSNVPVAVVGLDSGVASVTAGYYHSCALTTTGGVKCWGHNSSGQLGDGTNNDSNVPVDVVGLGSGVAFLSSGSAHTCAVTTGGGVKCWGYDVHGQLGDGAVSDSSVPVDVVGLSSGVSSVAAGAEHSCAVTTIGALKCWGGNYFGQLGDGTTGYPNMPTDLRSSVPVGVVGLASGVVSVAAGYADSCAVTTSGALKCWGYNYQGELGNGTLGEDRAPTDVIGLGFGVASVSLGSYHTCAVTTGGAVKCWGDNPSGQLGRDSIGGSSVPWDVVGLTDIAAVSAGGAHTCVVTSGGGMKCFGRNSRGQLGDGTDGAWISNRGPVDVIGLGSGTVAVPAG